MLTPRENLLETIHHGNPDRFVNQYEAFSLLTRTPVSAAYPRPTLGGPAVKDGWGVTKVWPQGTPGAFPIHDAEHIVIKDIEHWRDYVHPPKLDYSDSDWAEYVALAEKVDRKEKFATFFYAPGLFEQCHYLLEIQNCLVAFYEYPDEMHELIDFITDWEIAYAEKVCKYLKPDALFHHDDWGSQMSTFLSPSMFEEFFLEPYKRLYGYYKAHGVQLIAHHSDSYAATLVPYMIEMGIDIWQGVMTSNNVPELIQKYGGKISFMGDIDSAKVDYEGWTPEVVAAEVERACRECGKYYFIPSASQGLPVSTFPGVYQELSNQIDIMSKKMF